MDRRSFIISMVAAGIHGASRAQQEGYPNRAITIINPFPPGGASDVVTRPLAAVLEPIVHQPVVIETKAGAAGQVGAQVAAHAKPDGYTPHIRPPHPLWRVPVGGIGSGQALCLPEARVYHGYSVS